MNSGGNDVDHLLPPRAETGEIARPQPRRSGWFRRFSLRSLIGFQVLIALILGLLAARHHELQRQHAIAKRLNGEGERSLLFSTRYAQPEWLWSSVAAIYPGERTSIYGVDVAYRSLSLEDAQLLRTLPLEVIVLSRGVTEPAAMSELAHIPQLRRIHLRDAEKPALNDEDMRALASCPTLEYVDLASLNVNDEGVAALAKLPRVTSLDIQYAKMTIAGLRPWIERDCLRSLMVPMRLSAADCEEISRMTALEELTAYSIDEAGAAHLATMPNLKQVRVTGPLTGEVVRALNSLPE